MYKREAPKTEKTRKDEGRCTELDVGMPQLPIPGVPAAAVAPDAGLKEGTLDSDSPEETIGKVCPRMRWPN